MYDIPLHIGNIKKGLKMYSVEEPFSGHEGKNLIE